MFMPERRVEWNRTSQVFLSPPSSFLSNLEFFWLLVSSSSRKKNKKTEYKFFFFLLQSVEWNEGVEWRRERGRKLKFPEQSTIASCRNYREFFFFFLLMFIVNFILLYFVMYIYSILSFIIGSLRVYIFIISTRRKVRARPECVEAKG